MGSQALTGVFVWLLFISVGTATLCTNLDDHLCHLMANEDPNMCEDSCMAKLCTRFCGKCPLMCYACHEIDDAGKCQQTVQCNSSNEYCFTAQTFNDHFQETYNLGCAPINTCLQYNSIHHSKRIGIEAGCCNTDQCNNQPPVLLHITNTTSSTPTNANSNRSLCENLSEDICKRLSILVPNLCSDTCIANNICPHMCGKCYNCLSCDEVASPDKCNTTVECNDGKECFIMEVVTHDFKPAVRLGCVDHLTCQNFHSSVTGIFGKRQSFSLNGRCCIGEKCNVNVISTTIIPTTEIATGTTVPPTAGCMVMNHCPQGFHSYDQYCYHLGENLLTKSESKNYCMQHCSNLAEFDTTIHLNEFLRGSKAMFQLNNRQEFQAYLGIETHHTRNPKWVWDVSGKLMDYTMWVRQMPTSNSYCMIGIQQRYSDGSEVNGLQNVACYETYKPLCQIKLSF